MVLSVHTSFSSSSNSMCILHVLFWFWDQRMHYVYACFCNLTRCNTYRKRPIASFFWTNEWRCYLLLLFFSVSFVNYKHIQILIFQFYFFLLNLSVQTSRTCFQAHKPNYINVKTRASKKIINKFKKKINK